MAAKMMDFAMIIRDGDPAPPAPEAVHPCRAHSAPRARPVDGSTSKPARPQQAPPQEAAKLRAHEARMASIGHGRSGFGGSRRRVDGLVDVNAGW